MVASPEILEEYLAVARRLSERYPVIDIEPILVLITDHAEIHVSPALGEPVCSDPDDDKFLACAIASGTKTIVSGDGALRRVSGHRGVSVIGPRRFVTERL